MLCRKKAFGIYRHKNLSPASPFLRGFSDDFSMPVSRWTENHRSELPRDEGLEVLMESDEAGLCFIADAPLRQLYMFNHIEYDTSTLGDEYFRDSEAESRLKCLLTISQAITPRRSQKTGGAAMLTCCSAIGSTRSTSTRLST